MSIEGQGHFFNIYFLGFVCFVLYLAKISGERLQDHWSSGLKYHWFVIMTSLHFKGVTLPVEDNTDDSLRNFRRYVNSDTSKPMTHHYMLFSRYDHPSANRPTNEPLYKKTCIRGF